MLKYVDTKVTFSEVPDEVSLCISLSMCPFKCKGCHSSYLQENIGTKLTEKVLISLIKNNPGITCICFMGGDNDIPKLIELAYIVRKQGLKVAWYSGHDFPVNEIKGFKRFDYIKTGQYSEKYGPLTSPTTNQRFYKRNKDKKFEDITSVFFKK